MISVTKQTKYVAGKAMNSIKGCSEYATLNPFDIPFGQLIYNKNMEYVNQNGRVYLKTRRGSKLIKDISYKTLGGATFLENIVYLEDTGSLKAYNLDTGVTVTIQENIEKEFNNFRYIGLDSVSAIYGCNSVDGIYKVTDALAFNLITDAPKAVDIAFSEISGRMFWVNGKKVGWSEIQQVNTENLDNLETFNVDTNFAIPSPDKGSGFCSVRSDGNAMYFFKDTGIVCLPNAQESVADYYFPKLKASVGTISGNTVRFVKYGNATGFIYLATDKTLRFISPRIEQNAGVLPSIFDDNAYVISKNFQGILNRITRLDKCSAEFFDNKYILTIPSATSSEVNITIVVDCEKLINGSDGEYAQPYWYQSSNLNYLHYIIKPGENELYGLHLKGYISKLFDDDTFSDEYPGGENIIDWKIVTGWYNYGDGKQIELIKAYLKWGTDTNSSITLWANAFCLGELLPQYDSGTEIDVFPNYGSGGYESVGITNDVIASSENNEMTTAISIRAKGSYFSFGIADNTLNQSTIIYGIDPVFKVSRVSPIIKR